MTGFGHAIAGHTALHASEWSSGAFTLLIFRPTEELRVSKEKASCGLLEGFSGRLESARIMVQASLLRASPGSVGSIAQIR